MATISSEVLTLSDFQKSATQNPQVRSLYLSIAEPKESKDPKELLEVEIQGRLKDEDGRFILQGKCVTSFDLDALPAMIITILRGNKAIEEMELHIPLDEGGAYAIAGHLKRNRTLETLHIEAIGKNRPGDRGVAAFAEALKSNDTLRNIGLISMGMKDNGGVLAIVEMLEKNRSLRMLNLNLNTIGKAGILAISNALKTNRQLRILRLSDTFGPLAEPEVVACVSGISEMLAANRSLRQLDLCRNKIRGKHITLIAEALKENPVLNTLMLDDCGLEGGAGLAIADLISTSPGFRSLSLNYNRNLTEEDILTIIQAIKMKPSMKHLYFNQVPMSEKCILALAEILKINRDIRHMGLSFTGMTPEGASAIAKALKVNTSLERIELQGIGINNVIKIVDALKVNRTLNQISLSECYLVEVPEGALIRIIDQNNSLNVVLNKGDRHGELRLDSYQSSKIDARLKYYQPAQKLKEDLCLLIYVNDLMANERVQLAKIKPADGEKGKESKKDAEDDEFDPRSIECEYFQRKFQKLLDRIAKHEKAQFCSPEVLQSVKSTALALKGKIYVLDKPSSEMGSETGLVFSQEARSLARTAADATLDLSASPRARSSSASSALEAPSSNAASISATTSTASVSAITATRAKAGSA